MKSGGSTRAGVVLGAALVAAAFFPLRNVIAGKDMPYLADAFHQHYPGQAVVSRLLAAAPARLLTWDPYQFCGSPLLADPQRQVSYPPALVYRFLPFPQAYGWFLAFHILLALAGMAALLRWHGIGTRGAILGAIGFGLGVHAALLQSAPPFLCAYAWLPWIALYASRVSAGDRSGGALGLAVCGGWLILAGSPAAIVSAVALAGVIILTNAGIHRGQAATAAALGGVGAALTASVLVLPLVAYLPECTHGGMAVRMVPGTDAMAPWDLLGLAVPKAFLTGAGKILDDPTIYWASLHAPGILILALAASGWWLRRGDTSIRSPLRLVAIGLALGLGPWLPVVGRLETYVWPFSQLRHPGLWMELGSLGIAWLAGIGAHELEARLLTPAGRRVREAWLVGIVFLASIGFGSGLWRLGAPGKFIESRWGAYAIDFADRMGLATGAAVFLLLGLVALWLASRREISAAWAFRFIGLCAFLDTGLGAGPAFQPKLPAAGLMAPSATELALAAGLGPRAWGRVFVTPRHQIIRAEEGKGIAEVADHWRGSFRSNLSAGAGFRDASGDNPLKPAGTEALLESVTHAPHTPGDSAARRVFDGLGVRMLITRSPISGSGLTRVPNAHVRLYRREGSLRPAWVEPSASGEVVSAASPLAGEWNVRVRFNRPGMLVISESGVGGWRVASGPVGAAVTRAFDDALLGVNLPAGDHTVRLVYTPPAVKIGLGLSLLAVAGLLVFGLKGMIRNHR